MGESAAGAIMTASVRLLYKKAALNTADFPNRFITQTLTSPTPGIVSVCM